MPGSPGPQTLLDNLVRIKQAGLYAVARVDPIIYLTDDQDQLRSLVAAVRKAGADHLVASCVDVPLVSRNAVLDQLS